MSYVLECLFLASLSFYTGLWFKIPTTLKTVKTYRKELRKLCFAVYKQSFIWAGAFYKHVFESSSQENGTESDKLSV